MILVSFHVSAAVALLYCPSRFHGVTVDLVPRDTTGTIGIEIAG